MCALMLGNVYLRNVKFMQLEQILNIINISNDILKLTLYALMLGNIFT